ncbi:MAG: TolC family protein [Melioribacteraceae bacterium]|nr:TolC family protein [Melioribacteraceae bacterium]MCF8356660.1 TolC family protein [Melioribacteraceae bacterium]MCF8419879.1 TolC family protein [Melioribacteraceae bacterium]
MLLKKFMPVISILCMLTVNNYSQSEKNIIYLSWENVVDLSLTENLGLKSKLLELETQNLEEWRSYSSFIPTFSYQGLATKNLELPVFVFMGQRFVVGTNYSFQHSLDLTLPLYTGGARWFNLSIQKSLKKSLSEELKGKEEETVQSALESYYLIMLSNSLLRTSGEAVEVAKQNLEQVEKFYNAGTATELDLQRAKAQYYSTLPQYESAKSNRYLSYQRLKSILNISLEDSLSITDTLSKKDFLDQYNGMSLKEFKTIAAENRNDLKSLEYKLEATEEAENISLGSFTPNISLSANVSHQAQMDEANLAWSDYIRSKSIALAVYWPIFEGGKKIIDYQQSKIKTDQMKIMLKQAKDISELEIEQSFFSYNESIKNLSSLKQAKIQSEESMRISNLLYKEGITTQLDVLNAQLLFTKSKTEYLEGIYKYNVSQLALLKSIGMLETIWN